MTYQHTETAGVVVIRSRSDNREVLWARRPAERSFLGGFHGFPVGRIVESDADVPVDSEPPRAAERRCYGAAARELFEEFGLLVSSKGVHAKLREGLPLPPPLERTRRTEDPTDAEPSLSFVEALVELGLVVGADRFEPLGRWRTPEWASLETDTRFFGLELPADGFDELPESVDPAEHRDAEWIAPERALERWRTGEVLLSTPIRLSLEHLAETDPNGPIGSCFPPERERTRVETEMIEIHGGVRRLPLATPTLPPATHTNCWIVGDDELIVVDPGSAWGDEVELLEEVLRTLVDEGASIRAAVPTHHHDDHVGGLSAVVERFGAQVWAHPEAEEQIDIEADRHLEEGDRLELGGVDRHTLEVWHTPGHASDHLSLYHRGSRALMAGDVVAAEGTVVIDPPDGDMGTYLETLERLRALGPRTILPGHGGVVAAPQRLLEAYLEHRRSREQSVYEALADAENPRTPATLVPTVYDDSPRTVWPVAMRSLLAHLLHLVEQGRARRLEEGFVAVL